MSKLETIEALMESAIYCFSKDGYEGASLRDIARNANVPLSTIHFYFGSKTELFGAVARRAWIEIDQDRTAFLEKALLENPSKPPALGALIYALAYPVISRALSKSERDIGQIYILRSHTSHWQSGTAVRMLELADRSVSRWIDALMRIYPNLTRADVIWGFSFIVGAIYSWQVIDHRYDSMLGVDIERPADDVTGDIVAFCRSGIEAFARRRSAVASALAH